MTNAVFLKITSAVALSGEIHKAGSIVEVSEDLARDLLHRGKAEVATEADAPASEGEAPADPAPTDPAPEPDAPAKTAPKGK